LLTEEPTPLPWKTAIDPLRMIAWDMSLIFSTESDLRPFGVDRVAHIQGTYFTTTFQPVKSGGGYSGLFKSGAKGIIRLSTAIEPTFDESTGDCQMTPAAAVKMFVDGQPSINYVAMYTFENTEAKGCNFFQFPLSTHGPRQGGIGLKILGHFMDYQGELSTSMSGTRLVGEYTKTGEEIPTEDISIPFALILVPNTELSKITKGHLVQGLQESIVSRVGKKMIGKVAYKLYAIASPDKVHDEPVHIGNFVVRSEFTNSRWGDDRLFFQQQRFESDVELNPEWNEYLDDEFIANDGCPFTYKVPGFAKKK